MKRKNMMLRNLSQTIRKSMGRYIAIVAIIALGAGVFSGLRVTKVDMVATVQQYTDRQNMFDLQVMNSYGWTDEDVQALAQAEGIADAEGSVTQDALLHFEEQDDMAFKMIAIPENVNQVSLQAGRMPSSPDECLLDSFYGDESMIGSIVYVSTANSESTLENLACDSYTVVGLTGTPLYLNMQRGSTSVGDGSVDMYMYIHPEGFELDVYTVINLTLEGDYEVYTDEYDDAMDDMAEYLEEYCQPLIQRRYADVLGEAEESYAEGRQEYLDGMAEFRESRAEALDQLDEAERELLDAEKELADNRKMLEDNKKLIEESQLMLDEGLTTIAESRVTLAQTRSETYAQLSEAYGELMDNYSTVLSSQRQVESGLSQIDSGIVQIESYMSQIDSGLTMLEVMLPILESSVETAQQALDSAILQGTTDEETLAELEAKLAELTAKRDEYRQQKEDLEAAQIECETQLAELKAQQAELQATQQTLEAAAEQIELGFRQLEQSQLDADNQFAAAEAQLDASQAQIELNQKQLDEGLAELEAGFAQLEEGEAQLAEGRAEFEKEKTDALAELEKAENELYDARLELQDARKTIDEMEEPELYALTRNTNLGYVVFESDSDIVAGVSKIFPVFFLAVAALVCVTTMTRMIDEERTQIGVMKALGYSGTAIMGKYLGYSGTASLLGSALGLLLGATLFPMVIWAAYCIMYDFQDQLVLSYEWFSIIFVVLSYTGLTLLVTWYCCRRELKEVPAELIRPKAPAAGKQVWLEKLSFWKKLKFLDKVAIRNIFRYRQRMAMMLLGIGGCTALLITGFGLGDSISDIVAYQYEHVMLYDIGVSFEDHRDAEEQARFRSEVRGIADQVVFCYQGSIDLENEEGIKNLNFIVTDADLDGFIDLHTEDDEAIAMPGRGQAVVSIGTATALDISPGDTVKLRSAEMEEMTVTVSGVFNNNVQNYVIISGDTYREQWGREPEMQTAYVVNGMNSESHQTAAAITGLDGVLSVSVNQDTADTVGGMMDALDAVILLIVICAGLLAGTVLYNLTNINIKERIREIATIKVLGFNALETASYVFKENLTLTVFGILVGLVGGKVLHAVVMSYVRIDMVWFANIINFKSYFIAAVMTFLCAVIVDFIMYFQLERINMAEALKSVE